MAFKQLTREEKKELAVNLNWDYNVSTDDIVDLIEGKKTDIGCFTRENIYARSLQVFRWEDLVNLWGMVTLIEMYTEKTRRMLFPKQLRTDYDIVFAILRHDPLSIPRQSPEDIEELRTALFYYRRNRNQQGVSEA